MPSRPAAGHSRRYGHGRAFAALPAARQGLAAVEFALVGAILAIMIIGFYDLTNAYIMWRRLTQAAQSIGEIATRLAVQPDGTNSLTYQQALVASSAIFPIVPGTQAMAKAAYGVAMTVVVFTPTAAGCTVNCTYVAKPTWSAVLQGSQPGRTCGSLASVADGSSNNPGTLPADAFQASSILVVDVSATYVPVFLRFISGPLKLVRSAYLPPRSGTLTDWIRMTGAQAGTVTICP